MQKNIHDKSWLTVTFLHLKLAFLLNLQGVHHTCLLVPVAYHNLY